MTSGEYDLFLRLIKQVETAMLSGKQKKVEDKLYVLKEAMKETVCSLDERR